MNAVRAHQRCATGVPGLDNAYTDAVVVFSHHAGHLDLKSSFMLPFQ